MKKITLKGIFSMALMAACFSSFAQKAKQITPNQSQFELTEATKQNIEETGFARCLSVENQRILQQNSKQYTNEQFEEWLAPHVAKIKADREAGRAQMAVYNIPVVIHIIHNGDPVNTPGNATSENISDAQAASQINVMNQDYRKLAGSPGDGPGVDVEINFCLAQQDANGNPTNGIIHHNITPYSNTATPAVVDDWETRADVETMKTNTQWDPTKYINFWSIKPGGAPLNAGGLQGLLGYAQFPDNTPGLGGLNPSGGAANTDGVVAGFSAFGTNAENDGSFILNATYNLGRTMTHEVGHWLGLRHVWGDGDCSVDDFCADTPNSGAPNYNCTTNDSCTGAANPGNDPIENYMDYTNDACMDRFTQDQKDRMQAIMAQSPRRMELNSSIGCQAPTAVTFTLVPSPTSQSNCGSDSVDYTVNMTALNGFNETTTFSASGLPGGAAAAFSPTTLNGTGSTTMTISGLNSATDGNYTITITGTSTSETKNTTVSLTVGTGNCAVSATVPYKTAITRVTFNTIDRASSTPDGIGADDQTDGYSDITQTVVSTTVNRESSYNLSVNVDADGEYRTQTKVWIDWNQNCVFDASEEYDLGNANVTAAANFDIATVNSPLSVTVPANAVLGNTIMRVATIYSQPAAPYNYPTACGVQTDGEVEDYRIVVDPSLSIAQSDFATFVVTPNPSNGFINLTVSTSDSVKYSIFDIRGRKISERVLQNNSAVFNQDVNLGDLSSGMYIFTVESGAKKATQKIVIE
ncbi:GEVED domain-containing protein [Pseudofulvibacter geojedonensis]|uniref:GEVED domain-containing protein n=1 Tax=Pseudofulvibacter geojedonensis TaxID=1123758 RepID=A0ABW3I135_9FLAO